MAKDVLSDILELLRLTGALTFRLDVQGYWSAANSATDVSSLAPLLPAGTDQIIIFHIVTEGECWMRHPPGDAAAAPSRRCAPRCRIYSE